MRGYISCPSGLSPFLSTVSFSHDAEMTKDQKSIAWTNCQLYTDLNASCGPVRCGRRQGEATDLGSLLDSLAEEDREHADVPEAKLVGHLALCFAGQEEHLRARVLHERERREGVDRRRSERGEERRVETLHGVSHGPNGPGARTLTTDSLRLWSPATASFLSAKKAATRTSSAAVVYSPSSTLIHPRATLRLPTIQGTSFEDSVTARAGMPESDATELSRD